MKIKIEKLNQQELVLYVEKDKKRVASLHLVNLEMLCCLEVDKHYSDLGIQLIEHAKKLMFNNIQAIVLPQYVNDYKQCGFVIDKEMGESFVMSYHHFIEERFPHMAVLKPADLKSRRRSAIALSLIVPLGISAISSLPHGSP